MEDSSMDMTAMCSTVDGTKRELLLVQEKYEVLLQENYDLKKKVHVLEKDSCFLESEVSFLNNEKVKESANHLKLKRDLDFANTQIKRLESLLEDEKLQSQRFIREAKENKVTESKAVVLPDQEQLDSLISQIQSLEVKQKDKEESIQHLLDENAANASIIHQLKCEKQTLLDDLTETQRLLKQKAEDLINVNQSLESAREEKLLVSMEVQMLKASNGNAARGNSLFAEVEDNRQKIVAQREVLKLKYLNLKKVYNQKQAENNKLKMEIVKIRREDKDDEAIIHNDYADLIRTYKNRISELEQELKVLKERPDDYLSKLSTEDSSRFQWVSTVIENARKDAKVLQAEMDMRGSNYVFQGHQLLNSQKQNRKLKAINSKMQSQIDELRLEMDRIKAAHENVEDGISPPATDIAIAYQKSKTVAFKETVKKLNASLPTDKENQAVVIKEENDCTSLQTDKESRTVVIKEETD